MNMIEMREKEGAEEVDKENVNESKTAEMTRANSTME